MKKKTIMIIMCIAILCMIVGYAAFSTALKINGTANIASTWQVLFTKIEEVSKTSGVTIKSAPTASGTTATFNLDVQFPGDTIIYKITVENKGTINAIISDITASKTGNDAIKFNITGIKKGDILVKGTSTTFNVEITYDVNTNKQPTDLNEALTMEINYIQYAGQTIPSEDVVVEAPILLAKQIRKDNTAQPDTNIDFSQISSDTNGKGLYYTSTNTEDNKVTYYFRGAVQNNYVKLRNEKITSCTYSGKKVGLLDNDNAMFHTNLTQTQCASTKVCDATSEGLGMIVGIDEATCTGNFNGTWTNANATYGSKDELWRIIRINEDGTIRIIKEDSINSSRFNENYDDATYVGYMYGTTDSTTYASKHANTNSSTIKTTLDTWYQNNLVNYSSIIADSGFCGDRSLSIGLGYGTRSTIYGAHNRLYTNKTPQFKCPQTNDLYTTATSTKGNKALDYPIGLITADEVAYAGGVFAKKNEEYYLANGNEFWTMSPFGSGSGANVGIVSPGGILGSFSVGYGDGVRPAINLKSTAEIIDGGNGTLNNPYVIKVN